MPPENPRASTTDDIEGMIALFHGLLGPIFDLKAFKQEFPKIMNDFSKWIDPDIPFYYWTGIHERFHLKALPSFNEPSQSGIGCLDRVVISCRADPGVMWHTLPIFFSALHDGHILLALLLYSQHA